MEALPSLGNRRSTGLGQKKLGTAGEEAGDSGRGWIMPGLGSKNFGFYLNGYGGQQWGLSWGGTHTDLCFGRWLWWPSRTGFKESNRKGRRKEREAVAQWQSPCLGRLESLGPASGNAKKW